MFVKLSRELTNDRCRCGLVPYGGVEDTSELIVLRRESAVQYLAMIGVHHAHDPKDPEIQALNGEFRLFLDRTEDYPESRVLLSERIVDVSKLGLDEAEDVRLDGEQSLLTLWHRDNKIPLLSPEAKDFGEAAILFRYSSEVNEAAPSKDEIFAFYALREVGPWINKKRSGSTESFEDHMVHVFDIFAEAPALRDLDWTFEHFAKVYQQFLGRPLDLVNGENNYTNLVHAYEIPELRDKPIGRVSTMVERIRDARLAAFTMAMWQKGKSPFVFYGGDHVRTVRPTIELLGEPVPASAA